jgi:hypothetical protein
VKIAVVLLSIALAASVAVGLLGLWPNARGDSIGDRRETVRISAAVNRAFGQNANVTRIRLNYLPGRALVEVKGSNNGGRYCFLVVERFGDRVDRKDATRIACDF